MRAFVRDRLRAIRFALAGWGYVLRTQRNTWVHAAATLAVLALALWLHIPPRDWAALLLAIALVWAAEFFNTALEAVMDLLSPQEHPLVKIGKDVSAAAVLLTALAAVLIGLLILGPPLFRYVGVWMH